MEFYNFLMSIDFSILQQLIVQLYDVLQDLVRLFRGSSTAIITNGSL